MSGSRYVIMANGRGMRWGSHLGIPKHLITIDGETLLRRIVRQIETYHSGAEVVISSSDPRYETKGASRHTPLRNELEIDRFVPELIGENVCFLYGDTCYQDSAIQSIVETSANGIAFFGDERSIVGVKSSSKNDFVHHYERVRSLYLSGEIDSCIGWQLYQSYTGLPFGKPQIGDAFHRLDGQTAGFNTPEDFENFLTGFK